MHFVYVIRSLSTGRYYVGCTLDFESRLSDHNSGSVRSTKAHRPWKLVHQEQFASKNEALKREKQIKAYKGGNAFKKLFERS